MIRKLRGRVDEVHEDSVILDVGGVGYHVFCATRTLAALETGSSAELIIETHVREDHLHLYGFLTHAEREWFLLLTTVQGVGVKVALAIQSVLAPEQITHAIAAQDKAAFTRISGIGPKLGERIITELKSKVGKLPVMLVASQGGSSKKPVAGKLASASEDAVSALVNLGYTRSDAFTAVSQAAYISGEKAGLDDLIRLGLKELAR